MAQEDLVVKTNNKQKNAGKRENKVAEVREGGFKTSVELLPWRMEQARWKRRRQRLTLKLMENINVVHGVIH